MTTLYLLRHGESLSNAENRWTGQGDVDLSPLGYAQAERAADFLVTQQIDVIYSSDLSRAYNTALPTAKRLGLSITADRDLRELYAGKWEGMTHPDILRQYPVEYESWKQQVPGARPVGGESFSEAAQRMNAAVRRIAEAHDGQRVLIASHGGVIRTVLCQALAMDITEIQSVRTPTNASTSILTYESGRLTLAQQSIHFYLEEHLK